MTGTAMEWEKNIAQNVAFMAVPLGRGRSYHDGLSIDQLTHHAADPVGCGHQDWRQTQLLGSGFLQATEQHVCLGVGPGRAYAQTAEQGAEQW